MRNYRRSQAGMVEIEALAFTCVVGAVVAFVALLLMPLVERVSHGEIVVCESRFSDGKEVWRGPADPEGTSWRWQGLCKVTEYHDRAARSIREDIVVDGTNYRLRGRVVYDVPFERILEIHEAYGSEEGIEAKLVMPALRMALVAAAADPGWTKSSGGWAKRQLKSGLEYGLKRLSPTGAIWSPHEIQKQLEADLNRRLSAAEHPHGIRLSVQLSIVTER